MRCDVLDSMWAWNRERDLNAKSCTTRMSFSLVFHVLLKNRPTPSRRVMFFLQGLMKHEIPGSCPSRGRIHTNSFAIRSPCTWTTEISRKVLRDCLPDESPACVGYMPPVDPAVRRCGFRNGSGNLPLSARQQQVAQAYFRGVW